MVKEAPLLSEEWIASRLRDAGENHPLCKEDRRSLRPAAVLVPLFTADGQWHLLYTRRSEVLQDHKGQVAFPGGAAEPGDRSLEWTALREAHEEIGLKPEDVRLLGRMGEVVTVSDYCITPVVARIPWPYPLVAQEAEVTRIFSIPILWLAERGNWTEREYHPPGYEPHMVVFYELYDQEKLWGITARITLNLLSTLGLI